MHVSSQDHNIEYFLGSMMRTDTIMNLQYLPYRHELIYRAFLIVGVFVIQLHL